MGSTYRTAAIIGSIAGLLQVAALASANPTPVWTDSPTPVSTSPSPIWTGSPTPMDTPSPAWTWTDSPTPAATTSPPSTTDSPTWTPTPISTNPCAAGPTVTPTPPADPCGDGFCDLAGGEDNLQCSEDCYCGDGVCDPDPLSENHNVCPQDCAECGNGFCDIPFENNGNCPIECYCGDGLCDPVDQEDAGICPQDCFCGNGTCEPENGETAANCNVDCTLPCGDGICDVASGENNRVCAQDCYCGDGVCDPVDQEDHGICPTDCYCGNGTCEPQNCEESTNCPECYCGDGVCDETDEEDVQSCPDDCDDCEIDFTEIICEGWECFTVDIRVNLKAFGLGADIMLPLPNVGTGRVTHLEGHSVCIFIDFIDPPAPFTMWPWGFDPVGACINYGEYGRDRDPRSCWATVDMRGGDNADVEPGSGTGAGGPCWWDGSTLHCPVDFGDPPDLVGSLYMFTVTPDCDNDRIVVHWGDDMEIILKKQHPCPTPTPTATPTKTPTRTPTPTPSSTETPTPAPSGSDSPTPDMPTPWTSPSDSPTPDTPTPMPTGSP